MKIAALVVEIFNFEDACWLKIQISKIYHVQIGREHDDVTYYINGNSYIIPHPLRTKDLTPTNNNIFLVSPSINHTNAASALQAKE